MFQFSKGSIWKKYFVGISSIIQLVEFDRFRCPGLFLEHTKLCSLCSVPGQALPAELQLQHRGSRTCRSPQGSPSAAGDAQARLVPLGDVPPWFPNRAQQEFGGGNIFMTWNKRKQELNKRLKESPRSETEMGFWQGVLKPLSDTRGDSLHGSSSEQCWALLRGTLWPNNVTGHFRMFLGWYQRPWGLSGSDQKRDGPFCLWVMSL